MTETTYSRQQIAATIHEAIRGLQMVHLDPMASAIWEYVPWSLRTVATLGISRIETHPDLTPAQHHAGWVTDMRNAGWSYGQVRDLDHKLHPNLVTWASLPPLEQHKDLVGLAVGRALLGLAWES